MRKSLYTVILLLIILVMQSCDHRLIKGGYFNSTTSNDSYLTQAFEKYWLEYPQVRIDSIDKILISKDWTEVYFKKYGGRDHFFASHKTFYPDSTSSFKYYTIKSLDGSLIYFLSISECPITSCNIDFIRVYDKLKSIYIDQGSNSKERKYYVKRFEEDVIEKIKPFINKE